MPDFRTAVMTLVEASLEDEGGALRTVPARMEDKSSGGACIRINTPIGVGAKLRIQWRFEQFSGTARYCRSEGKDYVVGIQRDAANSPVPSRLLPANVPPPEVVKGSRPPALTARIESLAPKQTKNRDESSPAPQAAALVHPNGPTVVFDTSMGRITCQLYEKQAPKTVANFIALAEGTKDWTDPVTHKKMHGKKLYDGTTFHRVIPEFMIQGGDPAGTGMGDPGYTFEDEFDPNLNFDQPGRLAMANSGPNTDGSQFFITEQAYDSLNQHYTLFGQCDQDGIEVVKAIARVSRDSDDKPLTPVILRKVTIVEDGAPIPPPPSASAQPAAQPK